MSDSKPAAQRVVAANAAFYAALDALAVKRDVLDAEWVALAVKRAALYAELDALVVKRAALVTAQAKERRKMGVTE